jgi:hypothetical protein
MDDIAANHAYTLFQVTLYQTQLVSLCDVGIDLHHGLYYITVAAPIVFFVVSMVGQSIKFRECVR